MVRRYDTGEFSSPVRTPNGYLRCDAKITQVGVFKYRLADGTSRSELRLPQHVFNADSLASFEDVPLTNNHPRERLDSKNTRKFQAGNVKAVRKHDHFVAANVLITDDTAISEAEAGKNQLSCGYTCDLDFTPGVTSGIDGVSDGQRYDAIQTNIVGNHVAIVSKGRAGAESSLHLDAEDAIMVLDSADPIVPQPPGPQPGPGGKTMKTVRIDGVDFEMSEQAAQAVGKVVAKHDQLTEKVAGITESASKEKARADKADEDLAAAKKLHEDSSSDENVQKAVKSRVALERTAASILKNDDLKLDEMSATDIKKAVVIKVSPSAKEKLDEADEVYLSARYDAAVESFNEDEKNKPKPHHRVRGPGGSPEPDTRFDAAAAREKMLDANHKMGREPLVAPAVPNTNQQ